MLNKDKTEFIWVDSKSKFAGLKQLDTNVDIYSVVVEPTDSVRDLGVILDSELSMRQRVGKLSSICFSFTSDVCVSSGGCSIRRRDNDSFLHSFYHASTSATPCLLACQLARLHLFSVY